MDDVIAGYRRLTGKAPMMPHWAYGFWQSRQRYETQDQLLGVLARISQARPAARQYRPGLVLLAGGPVGLPLLRRRRASPIPRRWSTRSTRSDAHVMISVWPKFYPDTDNCKELDGAQRHASTRGQRSRPNAA